MHHKETSKLMQSGIVNIFRRLLRLQKSTHPENKTMKEVGHIKNLIFGVATIAYVLNSASLQKSVIDVFLKPLYTRIRKFDDTSYLVEFCIASKLLKWKKGQILASDKLDIERNKRHSDLSDPSEYTYDPTYSYRLLTSRLINQLLLEWSGFGDTQLLSEDRLVEDGFTIIDDNWNQINIFVTISKKYSLIQTKQADMIYFVTHVIMMGNLYGTTEFHISLTMERRIKLFKLLKRWFYQIYFNTDKVKNANLEVYFELAYCIIYLSFGEKKLYPGEEVRSLFEEVLNKAQSVKFRDDIGEHSTTNPFQPQQGKRGIPFFSDYHGNMVAAYFIQAGTHYNNNIDNRTKRQQ